MGRIQAPPSLGEASSWPINKKRLEIWKLTSGKDVKLMGAKIASTFTDHDEIMPEVAKRFYETVNMEELHNDGGYDYVIKYLEKELAKSGLHQMVGPWNDFEYFMKTKVC